MKRFCPKCGRVTEKFYENLCEECFLSKITYVNLIPEKIILRKCKVCERFFINDKPQSMNEIVKNFLLKKFKPTNVESITHRISDKKLYLNLNIKVYDLRKSERKVCGLIVKLITCKFCWMRQTGYYQAIIQVRVSRDIFDEILEKIENKLKSLSTRDELAFISQVVRNKFLDVYLGSTSAALKISKELRSLYKARVKITKKLIGTRKGKRVYRTTVLVSIT
ncbi:MAG: NMD3-related protein [Candidatus Aenigmarchaeota archaeon]|nr:NMD3-related protein [Candidatus Aenigmarchaeota archaeon]